MLPNMICKIIIGNFSLDFILIFIYNIKNYMDSVIVSEIVSNNIAKICL